MVGNCSGDLENPLEYYKEHVSHWASIFDPSNYHHIFPLGLLSTTVPHYIQLNIYSEEDSQRMVGVSGRERMVEAHGLFRNFFFSECTLDFILKQSLSHFFMCVLVCVCMTYTTTFMWFFFTFWDLTGPGTWSWIVKIIGQSSVYFIFFYFPSPAQLIF